jgi:2'-5' RNA ligase
MRLFVAVDVPDRVRAKLASVRASKLAGARWVPESQLHLTLRFIGEVEDARVEAVRAALRAISLPQFVLAIEGVGQFPPRRAASVIWAGVRAEPKLLSLAEAVEAAVVSAGFEAEARAFSPHITLARMKHGVAKRDEVGRFLEARRTELDSGPFAVDSFVLYSSLLSSNGAVHEVVETFALGSVGP